MHRSHFYRTSRLLVPVLLTAGLTLRAAPPAQVAAAPPVVSPEQIRILEGHQFSVEAEDFTADGKTLITGSRDGTIKVWNWQTGELLRTLTEHAKSAAATSAPANDPQAAHRGMDVMGLTFSPHGDLIASCSADKTIKLWDAKTYTVLRTLTGHTDIVRDVAFSPDQKMLASVSIDKTVRLWDVATGELKKTLSGHTARIKSVAYSPDGKFIITGGSENKIRVWDTQTGGQLEPFDLAPSNAPEDKENGIEVLSLTSDGKTLASSSHDTFVRIWDVQTRKLLHKLAGHTQEVDCCRFVPDGKTLISGCKDKTIKIWDVQTGNLLTTLTGHTGRVESMNISPDGKTLVTGGGGGEIVVRLWNVSKWTARG